MAMPTTTRPMASSVGVGARAVPIAPMMNKIATWISNFLRPNASANLPPKAAPATAPNNTAETTTSS